MRALLSFIVSTILFGSLLLAGVAAAAEPFNWSPQVDDPIHTPAELVESMHTAFGYNHCRAVHAKGVILQGEFTPDSHATEITKAPHLQGPGSKVTVRFSDFSGVPTIPDNDPMANPRGLAIRFELPGGANTDLVAHSFNGFPVSNTDDLRELMLAIAASGPCAATPTALDSSWNSTRRQEHFSPRRRLRPALPPSLISVLVRSSSSTPKAKIIMCVIGSYLRQANSYSLMRKEGNKAQTT